MTSLRRALGAMLPGRRVPSSPTRSVRRVDSAVRHRRLRAMAAVLAAMGLVSLTAGVLARQAERPPLVQVSTAGTTVVPRTWFFQPPYVLFAPPPTTRRPPTLAALGCAPNSGLQVPAQPADMSRYGSRVVEGTSVSAAVLLGHSSGDGSLTCVAAGASSGTSLWLAPASSAPPFAPTAMIIGAFVLFVGAVMVHPGRRTS